MERVMVPEVLKKDNYRRWSILMQHYLEIQGVWDVVKCSSQVPKQGSSRKWAKKNALALYAIKTSCGPKSFDRIERIHSAKDAWNALADMHTTLPQQYHNPHPDHYSRSGGGSTASENLGGTQYKTLLDAIYKGHFGRVTSFLEKNPDTRSATISTTPAGQQRISNELIDNTNIMGTEDLKRKDNSGNTALSLAACNGMMGIANCLSGRHEELLTIPVANRKLPVQFEELLTTPDANGKFPVQLACRAGHEDMACYLYRKTSKDLLDNDDSGFYLLEDFITKKMFRIAFDLLHNNPRLAFTRPSNSIPIITTLAQTPPPFFKRSQLAFWRRWIYNGIRVKVDFIRPDSTPTDDGGGILDYQQSGSYHSCHECGLVSMLLKFFAKKIYSQKSMDVYANRVLRFICWKLSTLDENEIAQSGAVEAIFLAIKNGVPEIAIEIIKANPNIFWSSIDPEDSTNMFACAVAYHQEKVAQYLYEAYASKNSNIVMTIDEDGNNMLHLAAKLASPSQLGRNSGAVLHLQSELRWFKSVENIVPRYCNHQKNKDGETPFQVFVREHENLVKEAEDWMKKTAKSSSVVGALIITVVFAQAFNVPGGNNQDTGRPILMYESPLQVIVFVVSDSISLFAASNSVLMFLVILTSRFAYEDFLKSLPIMLIIGLSSLFISIATMMAAFCNAFYDTLDQLIIFIPITLLAVIPVTSFVLLQFPLFVELCISTFSQNSFDRKGISFISKVKRWMRSGSICNSVFWLRGKKSENRE